jgi:hypothetical protein
VPFSGGAGSNVTVIDTTGDILGIGFPVHMVMSVATSAAGSESLTAAGKTFSTKKAKMTVSVTFSALGQSSSASIDQYLWFANEIGNMVKTDQPGYKDPTTSATQDSQTDILTSYTLK